jgi:beta-glucosidase
MTHSMPINNSKSNGFWRSRLAYALVGSAMMCYSPGLSTLAEDPEKPLSVRPEPQNAEWAVSWWMPRHEQKLKEKAELANCQLVWIGDSITHGWEGEGKSLWESHFAKYQPLNLGFSGDRTEHVLWRLQHGAVDGIQPKLVIMMIGTNNAGHRQESPADTAAGIEAILGELKQRLPDSRVLLLAIFPRGDGPNDELRKLCDETNRRIAPLADGKRVLFLDINSKFLGPNGELLADVMPDKLHPNQKGYEIWANAIQDKVDKLLAP